MCSAVSQVIAHQSSGNRSQRLLRRRHLGENVGAVTILFNHTLQTANLSLDTTQPSQVRSLDLRVDADCLSPRQIRLMRAETLLDGTVFYHVLLHNHIFPHASFSRRNRRLFVTTLNELSAIAALASTGLSNKPQNGYSAPAASGMPITL